MSISRRAFTLVELLVVVSVIVLLIAMLLPVVGRAREWARRSRCLSNQRQIGVAVQAYAVDHDGRYPLNESAAAFALTSRTGWVGWADARPRFDPYIGDPRVLYCPSGGDTKTCPNVNNFDTFTIDAGSQGWNKLAGWSAIPQDAEADFYVHVDYTIYPGFVRKGNGRLVTYLFGPDEAIVELPGFGFDRPTIPDRLSMSIGNRDPSDIPLSADVAYSLDPSSLTSVVYGTFVYWDDPYANAGTTTIMKAHLQAGRTFDGLGASFLDGHAEWRPAGVAGPRTALFTNGQNYNYVTWY